MQIELLEAIRDVVLFCITPMLLLLDFSYKSLSFDRVFAVCDSWWRALISVPFAEMISKLPGKTTQIFTAIYGKQHWSVQCIWRSAVSSILAMLLVFFVMNAVNLVAHDNNALRQLVKAFVVMGERTNVHPMALALALFFINIVVDYVSLLETRMVLSRIGNPSLLRTLGLTVVDYVATTVIWVSAFYIVFLVLDGMAVEGTVPFVEISDFWDVIFFGLAYVKEYLEHGSIATGQGIPVGHIIGLFSISTYFTSLVFYAFSSLSIVLRVSEGMAARFADLLFHYSLKRFPRPILLLGIGLSVIAQGIVAIAALVNYF